MQCAIYARQSIEKVDSVSIDAQIDRCKAICDMNKWQYKVYSDVGFSGKNIKRPNFEQLLSDIREGKINTLISYKLDRISRSITDFAQLLQLFEKHGVQYISTTEQFDTSTPVGRAMIYIVMVFAQLERETITQRVTDNYRYRATMGLYMGGNVPLGYASEKITIEGRRASALVVEEISAEIVRKLFSLYMGGRNTHQIACLLNNDGDMTSKQNNWTSNAVIRILRNIVYCANAPEVYSYLTAKGYNIFNDISSFDGQHGMCCFFKNHDRNKQSGISEQLISVGRHAPIIAVKEWITVQRKLEMSSDLPKRPKSSRRSWLAGLLKCADCGHSFGLKYTAKADKQYAYYYCRGRLDRGMSTCENDIWIAADKLEDYVLKQIYIRAEKLLEIGIEQHNDNVIESARITQLNLELVENKDRIKNIMENIGKGNEVIDRHLTSYITELDAKCKKLEDEINKISIEEYTAQTITLNYEHLRQVSSTVINSFADADIENKNHTAKYFINQILINSNGEANVIWAV